MKFKKYLAYLNNLAKAAPASLELEVVTAKDDEGNGYNEVHFPPCLAKFDGQELDNSKEAAKDPNVVLLN
jgi:hypothetical protein